MDLKSIQELVNCISKNDTNFTEKIKACLGIIKKIYLFNGFKKEDIVSITELEKTRLLQVPKQIENQIESLFSDYKKKHAYSVSKNKDNTVIFLKTKSFPSEEQFLTFTRNLVSSYPLGSFIFVLNHSEKCLLMLRPISELKVTTLFFCGEIDNAIKEYFSNTPVKYFSQQDKSFLKGNNKC